MSMWSFKWTEDIRSWLVEPTNLGMGAGGHWKVKVKAKPCLVTLPGPWAIPLSTLTAATDDLRWG